ncbi:MAG: ATP-binding protein [Candidatus Gastranaerophilales bacterium]|nr:ATP-binding protein [Candidatus Gastranaerophilales bacterium]
MKIKIEKSLKISTAIALTTSILITLSTLGIAIYSLSFVNKLMVLQSDIYTQWDIFQDSLKRLVLAFLTFSLITSYYLTKILINPLIGLVNGAKELSEGHFEYRFKHTKYLEVNKLIDTYNQMAQSLQILYTELDNKVKERTQELENANTELKNTQAMMVHSEKMRSLGELVAGITHEINNPINFVHGNLVHLQKYSYALLEIINLYETFESDLSEEKKQQLKELKKQFDLDFIKEDLPMLTKSCHEGTERTRNIIMDLKNFSRLDEMVVNDIDLPKEKDTTLNILHNKIKNKVTIVKEYDEDLPHIEGFGGQLNQVFMNILDNACYAIKEKGTIYIRLHKIEKDVIIEFEDTGCGMSKEQAEKIFDPFFTTKPVGSGTGLGLSISYKVIQKHNGSIKVDSTEGKGTKFTIRLPVNMEQE